MGWVKGGDIEASAWWKDLMCIWDGVGLDMGSWFDDNLWRNMGNGAHNFFGSIGGLVILDFVTGLEGCSIWVKMNS